MGLQNTKQLHEYLYDYTNDFLTELESKGSEHTSKTYFSQLKMFTQDVFKCALDYLTKEQLNTIDVETIISYKNDLYRSKKYTNSTINTRLTAIREYLKYMKLRKQYSNDIADFYFVHNLKDDSVSYDTIEMYMVEEIIDYIQKHEKHLVNEKVYFIKLAVETGLRASELLRLTWRQFKLQSNQEYVLIKSSSENKGKGNKDWKDLIHVKFYKEVWDNLQIENQDKLFTMSQSTVLKMLQKILKKLGYEGNYVLHSLKRTAVNNTHEYTKDVYATQEKGKHSNTNTTIKNYMDEVKYGATGYYSVQHKTNQNLFNEVSQEILLKALNSLDEHVKLLINKQIEDIKECN